MKELTTLAELKKKAQRLLDTATQKGLLSPVEHNRRMEELEAAKSFQDIDRLVSDLIAPDETLPPGQLPLAGRAVTTLTLLSERKISGPQLGDQTSALTFMGSTVLDFRATALSREALLEVLVIMGETKVLLAPGTPLEIRAVPVMGAVTEGRDLNLTLLGPRLIIQGAVIMGELKVLYG